MATFDHAVNSRLGQRGSEDNTQVLIFSGADIPEAAWHGMMIYRSDTQVLQIYRSAVFGGSDAFEDVVGGVAGLLTFVGDTPPTSLNVGDLWFDTSTERTLYRSAIIGADSIGPGEWVKIVSDLSAAEIAEPLPDALEIADLHATNIEGVTISAGTIAGGDVIGATVTGGVLRTAETGQRIQVRISGGVSVIEYYGTGTDAGGEPSVIKSSGAGQNTGLKLIAGRNAGYVTAGTPAPSIIMDSNLYSLTDPGPRMELRSSKISLFADDTVLDAGDPGPAAVQITGRVTANRDIQQDHPFITRGRSAVQSIPNNTWTKITTNTLIDSKVYNNEIVYDGTTIDYTLVGGYLGVGSGYYMLSMTGEITGGGANKAGCRIRVTDIDHPIYIVGRSITDAAIDHGFSLCVPFVAHKTATVIFEVYQNHGTALNLNTDVRVTVMRIG